MSSSPAAGFDAYTEALESEGAPLMGWMVLYSIFDGRVTPTTLANWFRELGLDEAFLPPAIRPMDVYERVTGPQGVRVTYPLADPAAVAVPGQRRKRRPTDGTALEALLMVRHVRRDQRRIVRHLVREVRDESNLSLRYDTRLAEIIFERDTSGQAAIGDGSLSVRPDHAAIAQLDEVEQSRVRQTLERVEENYRQSCAFLTGDRLRVMLRSYVEALDAIRLRPTGGVYFVPSSHGVTLTALRTLVPRFGEGSHLSRVPLPDQEEMREMVAAAFTTRAKDDLDKLAADIATATREGHSAAAIQALHGRFRAVQKAAAAHSDLLASAVDETASSMQLVQTQLLGLLTSAAD